MEGTLRIARLRTECHVAAGAPVAPAALDGTSQSLRRALVDALRGAFGGWLDRDDESVWVVRRLDLSLSTAVQAPSDVLAAAYSASLGRALSEVLSGDGDGVNAIRFASRAAYLARFVADAAAGEAWSRWYYGPLAGLKALPASAAIRTALVEDPARGLAALAALDDRALGAVAAALTPEDEQRTLGALAAVNPGEDAATDAVFEAAWAGCRSASLAGTVRGRALFAVARAPGSTASGRLVRAVAGILDLMRTAEADPSGRAPRLPRGPRREPVEEPSTALWTGREIVPEAIARAVLAEARAGRSERGGAAAGTPKRTRYGGAFLLLRDLDELPWAAWTEGWPPPADGTSPRVLRWVTAALCAGGPEAPSAFEDDALRDLFGIPFGFTTAAVGRWLRRVGPERRRALEEDVTSLHDPGAVDVPTGRGPAFPLRRGVGAAWRETLGRIAAVVRRRFARRLPGFADSSAEHLWRNFLAFEARIEPEDERLVVRCGRPPLHLVLTLTGMTRGLAAGRHPDGRPILLFPRE